MVQNVTLRAKCFHLIRFVTGRSQLDNYSFIAGCLAYEVNPFREISGLGQNLTDRLILYRKLAIAQLSSDGV